MIAIARFETNQALMFLIQGVTKESTREILMFFYGMASFVCEDAHRNSKARFLNKDIVTMYKDTPIPFRMQVISRDDQRAVRQDGGQATYWVTVSFPRSTESHDMSDAMIAAVELGLGLAEETQLPPFPEPNYRLPKCLKKRGKNGE